MNIFENAKFGDKFRTRDGRMAVFITKDNNYMDVPFICAIDYSSYLQNYNQAGECQSVGHAGFDIIGKWNEQ